ncbi:MAG: hypothetical protein IJY31_05450 [Muribaculaceae bacterium]|nr:hypothetical protein [Muribaculaceae bacterium]
MKNLGKILVSVSIVVLLCSCGGSKKASVQPQQSQWNVAPEMKLADNECIELQHQKPDIRAYGEGVSTRESRAMAFAETQARAQFRRSIESAVKTAQSEDGVRYENNAGADNAGMSNDMTINIAEGVVKNMVIIKTERFMRPDGSYHVYVCLEYKGDRKSLADEITQRAKQQVSDDERLKMQYDFNKFRERVEEELAKQKAQQ